MITEKFALDIARLGAIVNLYEPMQRYALVQPNSFFQRPKEFWTSMISALEKQEVRFAIFTEGDGGFAQVVRGVRVRARIACSYSRCADNQCDNGIVRGFFRRGNVQRRGDIILRDGQCVQS